MSDPTTAPPNGDEAGSASEAAPRSGAPSAAQAAHTSPILKPEALYGITGRIVRAIDPYTEAAPVAVLAHLLIGLGNLIGPGPHARVQDDQHPLLLNAALVGPTSRGRKGTSWGSPRRVLSQVDKDWVQYNIRTGLSSGEGLIYHVRDQGDRDPGVLDKRLLVIEPEFAVALKNIGRDGNTLSPVLREAWDSGNLATLARNKPIRATGAHICVIGHITAEEVRRYLTQTERANGFANRFLWLWVERSKKLPHGATPPQETLAPLVEELRGIVKFAQTDLREITRDADAAAMWETAYDHLSEEREGLLGAMTSRAEAQVLRLSALYAVLDRSPMVRPAHLEAALALWDYAAASTRLIFEPRVGDPTADRILAALRDAGPDGLTQTAIRGLFSGNKPAEEVQAALNRLARHQLAGVEPRKGTGGRPATVWRAS